MPVTRSLKGRITEQLATSETTAALTPATEILSTATASESATLSGSAAATVLGSATADMNTITAPTAKSVRTVKTRRSSRTTGSRSRRIIEAEEEVAALKLALAEAILKRLRVEVEDEDDDYAPSSVADEEEDDAPSRVEEWLNKTTLPKEVKDPEWRGQDTIKEENQAHRKEGVPARQPDVTSLAEALTQAVRMSRDAPRYIQELPVFNGEISNWLAFRAAFQETNQMFSKIENIARIRKSLKGAAHEAVSSMLISQPDPQAILDALERRFGRPDALAMKEMQKLRNLQKINDDPRDLCIFANKVSNIVATIEALRKLQYLYNPELVKIVLDKFTPILRNKWYGSKEDIPDLKRLAVFLNLEADKCGVFAQPEDVTVRTHEKTFKKRAERTYTANERKPQCLVCKKEHQLTDCRRFRSASVNERWDIAKKNKICFRCILSSHRRENCQSKACGEDGCDMAHHRLLHHRKDTVKGQPATTAPVEVTSAVEVVKNTNAVKSRRALLKIAPVTLVGPNSTRVDTYALMDDGSTITLIEESLAELLGIDGPRDDMWVQGLNETAKHENSKRVDVTIRGRYNSNGQQYKMRNVRTVQKLMFTHQTISRSDVENCAHLKSIEDQLIYQDARPKILIGQDNWELLVALDIRTGNRDQPVATNTKLGWVLHGCRTSRIRTVDFCGYTTSPEEDEKPMEKMMKEFFDLEALGVEAKKKRNDPDERALEILNAHSRRLPEGRFETALLWKNENSIIPNNFDNAFKRLVNLEKKLDREPKLKTQYEERIQNLLSSGYAEIVTTPAAPGKTWYLPHFAVCNPAKPKIRLVHDAAARSHGTSLNDMLLSGPDLLQHLPGVIMRFRQHAFAISADIKEMFMQIKIREEDRDALRFLWRGDNRGNKTPEEYRMTSVIFGATSSPCTALYIKNKNAEEHRETYPQAAKEIIRNHYMDDFITSFPTKEEAVRVSKEVDKIHKKASFVLRGWTSNDQSVLQHFDTDQENKILPIGSNKEKTLGLLGETGKDCISFQLNENKTPPEVLKDTRPPTKREALSIIMSLFDPLGLVSPVTTPAKRLMQERGDLAQDGMTPCPKNYSLAGQRG
ncbi:uncharacterized protein LOC142985756 [Anticarsia gemmatalis]|uniref:uncharacterized protein LOC142985756 n=1 Tax=Anticarsia gemmatalis TaxID=129554 RepID=UPI003F764BFB